MAFTSILRKTANSLAPLAIRLTRVQRSYQSCIFTALNHGLQSQHPIVNRFYPNTLHFSTAVDSQKFASDESLLRVIESEIQCAEESDEYDQIFLFRVKLKGQIMGEVDELVERKKAKKITHMADARGFGGSIWWVKSFMCLLFTAMEGSTTFIFIPTLGKLSA